MSLIEGIREQLLQNGCGGIKHLSTMFRRMDYDFSKCICYRELLIGIKSMGVTISESDLRLVFDLLDKDKNGSIDFCEFIRYLTPPMSEQRIRVINEAFDKLDVDKNGQIETDDLRVVYSGNVKRHPKYVSGEWTEEETLRNFLDSLDTPGCPDGKVTRQEFLNYYAGVSATVDDDCYFDLMMRSCYGLRPRGNS
ncbi:hypothetical protein LOTGIDRAFT_127507 [Lottia gigantea]|uniref:EF-hand domain-containing protein n=1 Tax=Lottia gigantea TaxID=225164 RepID=V3Z9U5_LOTGI|nr:hypothetical protein LOTGIDRAFT_127507 [Lottia gigantea]ESO87733.1 hypothetical protein LOTGIDRAFT_127507 [Lottia gigantea]